MATNDDIKEELGEIKKELAEMKAETKKEQAEMKDEQAEMKKEQAEMKKEQAEMRSEISILIEEIRGLKTSFEQSQQPHNRQRILDTVSSVSFPWPVTTRKSTNRGILCKKELAEIPELTNFRIEFAYWSYTDEIKIRNVWCAGKEMDLSRESLVIKMPYSGRYQFELYVDSFYEYDKGSKTEWYLCWKEAKDIGEDDDGETIKTKGEHGRQFLCDVDLERIKGVYGWAKSWYFGLECPKDTRVWLEPVVLRKCKCDDEEDRSFDYDCYFIGSAIE